jgi:glycosyltransferase involved in cell wall biosynthesis
MLTCMRIFIDAIPLLVRSAGVKNYLFHWILHLRRLLGDEQVRLFPFLDRLPDLDHEGSIADPPGTLARQALLFAMNLWTNHAADLMAPRDGIFHATKLVHPPRQLRLTATLHDLTCWLLPELHQPANVTAEKRFAEHIWKRAAGLIAVSESTRCDAVRVLGLNPEAIQVIYPGVAEPFFEATTETSASARLKYGLHRPYALYVGTVEPRKNLDRLLAAWQTLPTALGKEFDLVVAGPEGWQSAGTMARLRAPAPGVRYLAYVPEPDLPGITAGATVFVYPSLYEGFGFPVAQAMAAGVAVITSNLSSLPEVTGGAAALIDPQSQSELCAALERLLTSPAKQAQLAMAGRIQAQRFRWGACANESLEFFKKVQSRA